MNTFDTRSNGGTLVDSRRLKAARVLQGMTQRLLAEMMGRMEIEISRIETGRARPDSETKSRIAALLQRPAFELFEA